MILQLKVKTKTAAKNTCNKSQSITWKDYQNNPQNLYENFHTTKMD